VILCDVNVFIYAHKRGAPGHERYHQWLIDTLNHDEPVAVSDIVLSSFIRIVTHQRIFDPPSTLAEALSFATTVREHPNVVPIQPGTRHWGIFTRMCRDAKAASNLVPDAYLAALAIEHGCEWVTTDRDFARFPGLRWRHPLDTGP
jgi:toxin-antitoxin system PIN domain toxin